MSEDYQGYEPGPIRPPSEAGSLLLRITRNCPWNRCRFCGLYKGETFGIRPVSHVIRDIEAVAHFVREVECVLESSGDDRQRSFLKLQAGLGERSGRPFTRP